MINLTTDKMETLQLLLFNLTKEINFDLANKESNPLYNKNIEGTETVRKAHMYKNFKYIIENITLTSQLNYVLDDEYGADVPDVKGFVVLRDGHICLITGEKCQLLMPLFYKDGDERIHMKRSNVGGSAFENNLPLHMEFDEYNKRVKQFCNPFDMLTKQIVAYYIVE